MKRLAALAAVVMVLGGCGKQAESSTAAGVEFRVDKLFTVDGCTVYRFRDAGYYRYFTNCSGSTDWTERSGKTDVPAGVQGGRS